MSDPAFNWVTDFWSPAFFAFIGALLVIIPLFLAYRKEQRNARAKARFAIDQFNYTINWATGYLAKGQAVPPELRSVLQRYSAAMREGFALDSVKIRKALATGGGEHDSASNEPLKMLHLLFAVLEAGVTKQIISNDDLLAGKIASAYLTVLLGLDPDNREQDLAVLRTVYEGAQKQPNREVLAFSKMLIDKGPTAIAAAIEGA